MSDLFGVWQPIETAPRDGTWVLLAGGKCVDDGGDATARPTVGQWTTYLNGGTTSGNWQFAWYDGGFYGEYDNPTHWMALPGRYPARSDAAEPDHRPTKTEFLSARFDDFLASSELITRLEIEES